MSTCRLLVGDVRERLSEVEAGSVQCVVTSPPYWGLRDYGEAGQIGLEKTPDAYVAEMVDVFRAVRRVLREDGTVWLNLGDSYNGSQQTGGIKSISGKGGSQPHGGILKDAPGLKPKDLCMIPARVALALQADGWWLRSAIVWHKPNPMPESVTDRPTSSYEHVFLLARSERYFYDAEAIAENTEGRERFGNSRRLLHDDRNDCERRDMTANWTRNARNVWTITTKPYPGAHFATFPPELAERCILAGSRPGDTVLDPFAGSGTTGMVATGHGRRAILCELNPEYAALIRQRVGPMLMEAPSTDDTGEAA